MRRAYHVDLYNTDGHLLAHTLREVEPTSWVYDQMEAGDYVAAAVITEALAKGDDFDPEAQVVRVLESRAILRSEFEALKKAGTLRYTYYNPLKELSKALAEGVAKPPNEAGATVAQKEKKLDDFLDTLSDGELRILEEKFVRLRAVLEGGE